MSEVKKIDRMHALFGRHEGCTCGECRNFAKGRYQKCSVYGETMSAASDWAQQWEACGMFNQEYNGEPVIGMRRINSLPVQEKVEGQIDLFGEEEK